jgi:hypothetical protein
MTNGKFWAKKIMLFIACGVALAGILGWIVMLLWNTVLTKAVTVNPINFWQALGLFALSKILFGGFQKKWTSHNKWTPEMKEKWNSMSPEEKEKFKQEWRNKCKTWGRGSQQSTNTTPLD